MKKKRKPQFDKRKVHKEGEPQKGSVTSERVNTPHPVKAGCGFFIGGCKA